MKTTIQSKKAVLAGLLVGLGGTIYLTVESKILGSALFSLGLLGVMVFSCSLYTGKVGYLSAVGDVFVLLKMCLLNFVGAAAVGLAMSPFLEVSADVVVSAKLQADLTEVFIRAIFCGIMIYLAVELYKRTSQILLVVMPIMIFILCGFEHCVANAFYFAAARYFDTYSLAFFAVGILGNGVGSVIIHLMNKYEI